MPTKAQLQEENDDLRSKLEEMRVMIDNALDIDEGDEDEDEDE